MHCALLNWTVNCFCSDAGEHEEYNTGAPLHSFFLADAFSMRATVSNMDDTWLR